jgi:hypothetical protein
MEYSFDIEVAKKYGVDEAIMIKNFQFWIMKNKANNKNFHDGRTWTYNSTRAFSELFIFWTEKQIRRILKSLIDKEVILTGNYNKISYDRTLWYAFRDENEFISLCPNGQIEKPKQSNQKDQKVEPIPYINTDNNTDTSTSIGDTSSLPTNSNKQEQQTKKDKLTKKVIDIYHDTYCARFDTKPVFANKDFAQAKRIGEIVKDRGGGEDYLRAVIDNAFSDKWFCENNPTLSCISSQINKYLPKQEQKTDYDTWIDKAKRRVC